MGSISGKTSFILAGDNMGPSKLQKAEKLGVPLMSEDEFLSMIETASPSTTNSEEAAPQTDTKQNSPIQLDLFS